MFSRFRDPRGRFTLLVSGIACLLLAAFLAPATLTTPLAALPLGLAVGGIACIVLWSRRRARDRYDLKRLFDEPPPVAEEPYLDQVPEGEVSAPYCGWCDEAYPPGTRRCLRCGRDL
jgi:hypothetical protein